MKLRERFLRPPERQNLDDAFPVLVRRKSTRPVDHVFLIKLNDQSMQWKGESLMY
jgi:hypothetical protein